MKPYTISFNFLGLNVPLNNERRIKTGGFDKGLLPNNTELKQII